MEIFRNLKLDHGMLDAIKDHIPAGWITDARFAETSERITDWWAFLRERPFDEVDQAIFG
jgi:hypothetical protein